MQRLKSLKKNKRIKITIGTPSADEFFHRKYVQSLMALQYPENTDVQFSQIFGYQLPFARNNIVEDAIKNNSDYLFFVDADMIFPPDTLVRLLSHNLDFVNALAFRRVEPHYPCLFKWNEETKCYETMQYKSGLIEVDATGMAACLIKMSVFKKMKKPWYYYQDHLFSSDLTFCRNARKAGVKIIVDTDLKIGHLGAQKEITEKYYLKHLDPTAKKKWNEDMSDFLKDKQLRL